MARTDARGRQDGTPGVPADPLLLRADLAAWAGDRVAGAGRRAALLGRVEMLQMAPDGRAIEARVRGNRPLPYQVHVAVRRGELTCRCTCAREMRPACKHAVAAVEALRFPRGSVPSAPVRRARGPGRVGRGRGRIVRRPAGMPGFLIVGGAERTLTRDERIAMGRDEEIATRRQRARRERAAVEPVENAGGGVPRVTVSDRREGRRHVVTLHDHAARQASCTCADYAESELQTCQHVERALGWARRYRPPRPDALAAVWWRPRPWMDRVPDPLQEIRVDIPVDELPRGLDEWFSPSGWLRPTPPDRAGADWVRDAVDAVRAIAARRGWPCDVDGAVGRLILEADESDELRDRLSRIDASCPSWGRIVAGIPFDLHPYQELGALFLARSGRAFLADDMGLGKTVQAIVAALLLRHEAGAPRALVVCPASLKHQWAREIERVCGESAAIVEGPPNARRRQYETWTAGFLILNYELVLRDLDAIRAAGADVVILDEAQRIKNWGTKTARAVKQLDSRHAFVLTGTPLENRLLELHSLVEFLHPRALGPRWRLFPFHAVIDTQGRVVAYEGLEVLRARLRRFFLRRDRPEVLDQLPERTDNTFWTGMTPRQRKPYRSLAARVAALLGGGQQLAPGEVRALLQALTGMRILCNSLAQYTWERSAKRLQDPTPPDAVELRALGSPKLEEFARVLEDLLDGSDEKIVVFSQWERALRLAHFVTRDVLERRDLRGDVFHGGLSSRARGDILDAFAGDPEFRVLFSTDAGGLGLNLQESASIVVNLEVPWNPAVLEQRVGRVHRLGQRRSVQVLHFVTRGAIEERVRQVVESKRALFDGLLVTGADRVEFGEDDARGALDRVRRLLDGD